MALLDQREKEICNRLKDFREETKVPRSRFALSVGVGSERLASYESARAPIRLEVFLLLSKRWNLNPHWLATGGGHRVTATVFELKDFLPGTNGKDLFSKAYDKSLASGFDAETYVTCEQLFQIRINAKVLLANKARLKKALLDSPKMTKDTAEQMRLLVKEIDSLK